MKVGSFHKSSTASPKSVPSLAEQPDAGSLTYRPIAIHIHGLPLMEDIQMYDRILLVPIDETEDAEKSVIWTLENLYRPNGDLLYFLHVVPERQFEVIGGLGDAGETIVEEDVTAEKQVVEDAKDFIKNRILQLVDKKQAPHKVEIVRFRTDAKSVGDVIVERAASLKAAAVVMKKHAMGAIRAFFVGSATEHVAHLCRQPVVVLH